MTDSSFSDYLDTLLRQQAEAGRYRICQPHEGAQSPILHIQDKDYLAFCSNDYLGLASHPEVKNACQAAIKTYAVGSGAAHLVTGHTVAHAQLEKALARYTQCESALLFSTGYMANLGVITALVDRQDAIFSDKLNHASLVDAALLAKARLHRYPHGDMATLDRLLTKSRARHKLIITDGVFSMEGDLANLPHLVHLAKTHDAWLMVDDAHGLGVMGQTGRGTLEAYGLGAQDVPILMGTLGKAFGGFGAFVAGSHALTEVLIQFARSYIYTTALPSALAVAMCMSLRIAETEHWRRYHLHKLIAYFRAGAAQREIMLANSLTPIQPLIIGDAHKAVQLSTQLYECGIIVTAIRPPTVPVGSARLRITLSALHEEEQIDKLLDTLVAALS